jgi:hypothetical protein
MSLVMKMKSGLVLAGWLVLGLSAAQAQYSYTTNGSTYFYTITNSAITITNFSGSGNVSIPGAISNVTITAIGSNAFANSFLTGVTIPGTVTNIGGSAFASCYQLTNVSLPGSVASIGPFAFIYCTGLTNVTIPVGVTNIGIGPFASCASLAAIGVNGSNPSYSGVDGVLLNKSQTILVQYPIGSTNENYTVSNGVATIGDFSFQSFQNLTNLTLPSTVTSIGTEAFEYSALEEINLPNSVTNIGNSAFAYSFLDTITMSSGIKTIGNSVFAGSLLTDFTVPNGVTSIGDSAFYSCSELTNVTISGTVTNIGTNAFNNTSLVSITIPAGVTKLGAYSFAQCSSLDAVYFYGNAPAADATVFADVFQGTSNYFATAYYVSGMTGWPAFSTNTKLPIALWTPSSSNPIIINNGSGFGIQSNRFGFTISWATTNPSVVVSVKTNLSQGSWVPVSTNTLTNGSTYFSESRSTNSRARFFRVSAQ